MNLALIGYGRVGRAFASLLARQRAAFPFRITGALTRTRGVAVDLRGLAVTPEFRDEPMSVGEFLRRAEAEIAIEVTPLNPLDGEPAITHVRECISLGIHVVTANKGPVAFAYRRLAGEAASRGVCFRHESVTMDGTPLFSLVRNTLPGVRVTGFAGALNSTTKVIIEAMQRGLSFEEGIAEAQRAGVTEADATFDTEGWDSAAKAAALANVLMNADTTPAEVDRRGIGRLTPEKLADLKSKGKTVVLISRGKHTSHGVRLRVRAEVLPQSDILASVHGTSNVLILETDLMGEIGVFSLNPGLQQTAYGLFADVVDIAKNL